MEIKKAESARNILYKMDRVKSIIDELNTSQLSICVCDMKYGQANKVSEKASTICKQYLLELNKELIQFLKNEVEHMRKEIEEL